jgi:hypothetical protein
VSTAKKEAQTPVTTKKSKTRAKSSSTLSVADKTTCETKISRRSTFAQQDEAGVTATTARVTKEVDAARSVGVANPVFSRAQKHVVHEIAEDARAPVKRLRRRSPVEEPKKSVFAESSQFDYDDVTPAAEERTSAVSEPLSTSAGDWKPTVNVSGFVTPREEAAKRINDVIACAPPVSPLDTPTTAVAPLEENYWCCDDGCKNIIVVTAEVCSQCQLHWRCLHCTVIQSIASAEVCASAGVLTFIVWCSARSATSRVCRADRSASLQRIKHASRFACVCVCG